MTVKMKPSLVFTLSYQFICVIIILSSCQLDSSPENPSITSPKIDKQQFEDAIKIHETLYEKGDVDGFMNIYSDDAEMLTPDGHLLDGKAQIQSMWQGMAKSGMNKLDVTVTGIWGDSILVATQGNWSMPDKKGSAYGRGKFIYLWKKQDKQWKVFRDIFSMEPITGTTKQ